MLATGVVIAGILAVTVVHSVDIANVQDTSNAIPSCISFGLDLYKEIVKRSPNDNIVFSPASLCIATAMVYNAARGQTARQIQQAMKADVTSLNQVFGDYLNAVGLAAKSSNDSDILLIANKLFLQQGGRKLLPAFVKVVKKHYQMDTLKVNFAADPAAALDSVNNWVDAATRHHIPELLTVDDVTPETVFFLVNAVYFKSTWKHPFPKRNTHATPFKAIDGHQYKTKMMYNSGESFKFGRIIDLNTAVIELPYNGDFSMLALLPLDKDDTNSLPALESQLTTPLLRSLLGGKNMAVRKCQVLLPVMEIEKSFDMTHILSDLGITDLFNPGRADLSGLDGTRDLSVSSFVHAATLTVNEEGSEASAATAVGGTWRSAWSGERFIANRPFVFVIADRVNKVPLFIGRYAKPAGANVTSVDDL